MEASTGGSGDEVADVHVLRNSIYQFVIFSLLYLYLWALGLRC